MDELVKSTVLEYDNARGLAIIICNSYEQTEEHSTLCGTFEDGRAMESTFKHLGFATITRKNATEIEMCGVVQALATYHQYPDNYNCFVVVFSGHGSSDKKIVSNDGKFVDFQEAIIDRLHPDNSPLLCSSPRIILIDACRGNQELRARGPPVPEHKLDLSVPNDVFVAYSTMEGHQSYERTTGGVWMQELAKELRTSSESIGDVVANVNNRMKGKGLQVPQTWNTTVRIILSASRANAVTDGDDDDDDVERDHPRAQKEPSPHAQQAELTSDEQGDEQVARIIKKFPKLDSSNVLTIDDLPRVRKAMNGVASKWFMISVRFEIPSDRAEDIKKKYKKDSDQCLTAIIVEWLRRAIGCSWRNVVSAIAAHVGGDNPAEAEKVAQAYQSYSASWATASTIANNVDETSFASPSINHEQLCGELVGELIYISPTKYFAVGLILGVPYKRLEVCDMEDSYEDKITEMVNLLLGRKYNPAFGEPSWKKVVIAVAADDGGADRSLAKKIAAKHPKGIQPRASIPGAPIIPGAPSSPPPLVQSQGVLTSRAVPEALLHPRPRDAFKTSHYATLLNDLTPVARKWDDIAIQLGFDYDQTQNIKANLSLIPQAPHSYLKEVIGIWLKQEPPKSQYPTMSNLLEALKSESVGEVALSESLKEKYKPIL